MNSGTREIISKINKLLNEKYEKDFWFSEKRKNWAFFVSLPVLIELKREAGDYAGVGSMTLMREVKPRILGREVFGVDGLDDDTIYFTKKLSIK